MGHNWIRLVQPHLEDGVLILQEIPEHGPIRGVLFFHHLRDVAGQVAFENPNSVKTRISRFRCKG
jgi:hypothetical protein